MRICFRVSIIVFILLNFTYANLIRKYLAVFFNDILPEDIPLDLLHKELRKRLSIILNVQKQNIIFDPIRFNPNGGSFATFYILGQAQTLDSIITPETFATYSEIFRMKLKEGGDLTEKIQIADYTISLTTKQSYIEVNPTYISEDSEKYLLTSALDDLTRLAIYNQPSYFQLKFNLPKNFFINSYKNLESICHGIREIGVKALKLNDEGVVIESFNLDQDELIIKFTIYHAADETLKKVEKLWKETIEYNKNLLATTFDYIDLSFEPFYNKFNLDKKLDSNLVKKKVFQESIDTPNVGLIAGSIFGVTLIVGVVAGLAVYLKKRANKQQDSLFSDTESYVDDDSCSRDDSMPQLSHRY